MSVFHILNLAVADITGRSGAPLERDETYEFAMRPLDGETVI